MHGFFSFTGIFQCLGLAQEVVGASSRKEEGSIKIRLVSINLFYIYRLAGSLNLDALPQETGWGRIEARAQANLKFEIPHRVFIDLSYKESPIDPSL